MSFDLKIEPAVPIYQQIAGHFARLIRSGELRPGQPLPSCRELARNWNVNFQTVHKAMRRLKASGLVGGEPRCGSVVRSENQKAVIGVLAGPSITDESSHFLRALIVALRAEIAGSRDFRWTSRVYDGLNELRSGPDSRRSTVRQQLVADLKSRSFNGIVRIVDRPGATLEGEISRLKAPSVRFGVDLQKSDVVLDMAGFISASVEFIVRKGLKKICYLRNYADDPSHSLDIRALEEAVRRFSLPRVEIHQISGGASCEQAAYEKTVRMVEQWRSGGRHGWPAALLVLDDIATRGVSFALAQKGIKVPAQVLLMSATNEGIIHYYGMPVVRYDFSSKAIAKSLLDILHKRMLGEALPELPIKIAGELKSFQSSAGLAINEQN